MTLKEGAR
jgi:uncharacterized protein YktB (UPF0637 family)